MTHNHLTEVCCARVLATCQSYGGCCAFNIACAADYKTRFDLKLLKHARFGLVAILAKIIARRRGRTNPVPACDMAGRSPKLRKSPKIIKRRAAAKARATAADGDDHEIDHPDDVEEEGNQEACEPQAQQDAPGAMYLACLQELRCVHVLDTKTGLCSGQ